MAVDPSKRLLTELAEFFVPLLTALESPPAFANLMRSVGWDVTGADLDTVLTELSALADDLAEVVDLIEDATESGAELDEQLYLQIATTAAEAFDVLRGLHETLTGLDVGPELFADVFDLLLAEYLRFRVPAVFYALILLGVLERDFLVPGRDGDARDVPFERFTFRWDRLRQFWSSPGDAMQQQYGWGTQEFDGDRVLTNAALLVTELGVIVLPTELPTPLVEQFLDVADGVSAHGFELPLYQEVGTEVEVEAGVLALQIQGRQPPTEADRGVGLMPYVEGAIEESTPVTEDGTWTFVLRAGPEVAGGMVFGLHPSGLHVDAGVLDSTVPMGSFRMELQKSPANDEDAFVIVGDPAGTRLEAEGFTFGVGGEDGDFYAAAGVADLRLVMDVADDPLLSRIVPEPIVADAGALAGGWRLGRGIYFEQGTASTVRFPLHVELGDVLRLRQFALELQIEPVVALTAMVSGDVSLGALTLSVEELGLRVAVVLNRNGAFGTFDLDLGVRFPSGYHAELDLGPIRGGGGLSKTDHDYRGALALTFEQLGLAAFAVLTTQLPSGRPGYSFVASIFGDVDMQLGYGFRLTGVGGLIGIDRGGDVEALRAALAQGRLDAMLFPREPIRDAALILEDLATLFPARPGHYLVGPMVRLTWGTPTLIEGKIGVVLELGAETRVVILGSLSAALPVKAAPIVVLRLDFIGTIEFTTGAVAFDATLTASRILSWPVSGEAAVRTGWGRSAGLVASVGGFHPEFSPPPGFPGLQKMTIDFATNNPSLTLVAYLAITLNSVQAGANASLYAKGPKIPFVGRFAVEGSVGFDALISFDPFAFDATLWLGLDLLRNGNVICGIGGDLRLRGPNRYEVKGKLKVSALGVTVKVKINKSWGTKVTETPQLVDGARVLEAAVRSVSSFEPIGTPSRISGAGFAGRGRAESTAVIDPSGGLRFAQQAVPLDVSIDRIGTARLVGAANTFDLAFTDHDGTVIDGDDATSEFVRGAFFDLNDAQRLRGPATETHKSGIELTGRDALVFDADDAQTFELAYETVFLGDEEDGDLVDDHVPGQVTIDRFVRMTAQSTSTPLNSAYVPEVLRRERIDVRPVSYVAVGAEAVSKGPRPTRGPDGVPLVGALSTVTQRLGRDERALASYLAAPVG